jgi:hypothetical protein
MKTIQNIITKLILLYLKTTTQNELSNADKIHYCKPLLSFLYGKNHMIAVRYTYVLVSTAVPNLDEKRYFQVTAPFSNKPCFKNFMFTACIFSKTVVLQ